jgi:hypothetical protein
VSIIGRQAPADIVVPGPQVSARHAAIVELGGGRYGLTDLDSSNGTFVNGERVLSVVVTAADRITLGSCPFDLGAHAWRILPEAPRPPGVPVMPRSETSDLGTPWERRSELGGVRAAFESTSLLCGRPSAFFAALRPDGGLGASLLYMVPLLCASAACTTVYQHLGWHPLGMSRYPLEQLPLVMLVSMAATALLGVVGLFLGAGIDHLLLLLVGGARRGFETTARVDAYAAGAAAVLSAIPIVGIVVAGFWNVYLRIVGFSVAHGVGRGRAAAAVLLPIALCGCALAAVVFLLSPASRLLPGVYLLF